MAARLRRARSLRPGPRHSLWTRRPVGEDGHALSHRGASVAPMTSPASWPALHRLLDLALRALPSDGLLDVLTPRSTVTATWLPSARLLLELSGAPPGRAALAAGWRRAGPGCGSLLVGASSRGWHSTDREETAGQAASEVVMLLRDLLRVAPDDVELFVPRYPPPRRGAQDVLW